MASTQGRPLRADARRNRDAVLAAARQVFEAEGIGAATDGIASAAGVGNATLYRHFPTRDDLLAAVLAESMDDLVGGSADLDGLPSAGEALLEWLYRLAWRMRVWQDLPTCLADAIAVPGSAVSVLCTRLTERTAELLDRARREGSADPSLSAVTVVELATTAAWAIDRFGDDADAARDRVALVTAGVAVRAS